MPAKKGNKYAKGNKGGGAPTAYDPNNNGFVISLYKLGATDEEMAEALGVTEQTINNWKKKHKEFILALKKGKIEADAQVANSLHKRAIGYEYDETTFEKMDNKVNLEITSNGDIKTDEAYKKKVVTKHMAPDTGAAMAWLKNRRPKQWSDKQEIHHTGIEGILGAI